MNSLKPLQWAIAAFALALFLYFAYQHLQYLHDVSFLGGILLLEIVIASLWKYDERFFLILMVSFLWAGMNLPLQGAWTGGRWVVLGTGAAIGYIIWTKNPRLPFGSIHLIAFFCICAAFVSATVSQYVKMASLKAFSLMLLFLYCAAGARLAIIGREGRFFRGLLWLTELMVYATAICYLGLNITFWGNPNSLGAAMAIGCFPVLLWGWHVSDGLGVKFRRLAALSLCTFLVLFSVARAGLVAIVVVTIVFCFSLRQYRLLIKVVALALVIIAATGMFAPDILNQSLGDLKDTLLYKGHKNEGILGSRRSPWELSITSIKEHPLFGTGYGTAPTGEDPGLGFGRFASSSETVREHGSSYMTIAEWVGLLGVLPFLGILGVTILNVWRVCWWMRRTADPRNYSIPLAMIVLAGLTHANFEDWLFAVGSYLSVFFWASAFMLADLVPSSVEASPVRAGSQPTGVQGTYGYAALRPIVRDAVLPNR